MKFMLLMIYFFLMETVSEKIEPYKMPEIDFISNDQVALVGDTVELFCSVKNAQRFPVHWIKLSEEPKTAKILSSRMFLTTSDDRFSIHYDINFPSKFHLMIKNVRESDEGLYRCAIYAPEFEAITSTVKLEVRRELFILENSTKAITRTIGETVKLECFAKGNPKPTISWDRGNDKKLPSSSIFTENSLKILSIKEEDAGMYYCNATNKEKVKNHARRSMIVIVQFPPRVIFEFSRMSTKVNYNVDITCYAKGNPLPVITWSKDGLTLNSSRHQEIETLEGASENVVSILHITSIQKYQFGHYICHATNSIGKNEDTSEVFETIIAA